MKDCDWFTLDFIEDVVANELPPERGEEWGPFEDKLLRDFFNAEPQQREGKEVYIEACDYLSQEMVGRQLPFSLKDIPFTDRDVLNIAEEFGVSDNHEVERGMIGEIGPMLQCLIAPKEIRRKVVYVVCAWGNEEAKRDTLLWAELVKKGVKAYLESKGL